MCYECISKKTESVGKRPLSLTHPHLMDEWDFLKNGEVRPEYLTTTSHMKVHWYHKAEDGQIHEWVATIHNRSKKIKPTKCPYCGEHKIKVGYGNDLESVRPEIAALWHPSKNGSLLPSQVLSGSRLKVWWFHIAEDGQIHEWDAVINEVIRYYKPNNCPICQNKRVGGGNDLKSKRPEIAKEWHHTKNGSLKPEHVTPGSGRKVHWKCQKHGHEWFACIKNRTRKVDPNNCPYCSNYKVGYGNDLLTNYPELCEEWDDIKNGGLSPKDVPRGSRKKAYWLCKKCGHSWRTAIKERTHEIKPTGCPLCSISPVSRVSQEWLDYLHIPNIPGTTREVTLCIGGRRLQVDGFDPKTNTVFEFLGDYWHGNLSKLDPGGINAHTQKTFKLLNTETMNRLSLIKTKYNVVYVWEKDYKNGIYNSEQVYKDAV